MGVLCSPILTIMEKTQEESAGRGHLATYRCNLQSPPGWAIEELELEANSRTPGAVLLPPPDQQKAQSLMWDVSRHQTFCGHRRQ